MAYSATVTPSRKGIEVTVTISETDTASASEATIPLGFTKGRLLRQMCTKTAGTASTVDPILGTAANPSGINVVVENDTAAATVDNSWSGGVTFYTATGILYHRSVPASGTDNSISTEYHILVGWE